MRAVVGYARPASTSATKPLPVGGVRDRDVLPPLVAVDTAAWRLVADVLPVRVLAAAERDPKDHAGWRRRPRATLLPVVARENLDASALEAAASALTMTTIASVAR